MDEPHPSFQLTIRVAAELRFLLPRDLRERQTFTHTLQRRASLKDVVESLGIPHTEIGALYVGQQPVNFKHPASDRQQVSVHALPVPHNVLQASLLRPHPLREIRFIVDLNVAHLGRLLRSAGFDASHDPSWSDGELARLAAQQKRILLTRDRALLRYACVEQGHLVRAVEPRMQLREVIRQYGLQQQLKPFSRCMRCNGQLNPVAKHQVLSQLEPLTIRYYEHFKQCRNCGQVYWKGSHQQGLEAILSGALN